MGKVKVMVDEQLLESLRDVLKGSVWSCCGNDRGWESLPDEELVEACLDWLTLHWPEENSVHV